VGSPARHTLRGEFRRIDPAAARILPVEGGPRVLLAMPGRLSASAQSQLEAPGVEVQVGTRVTAIDAQGIEVEAGSGVSAQRIAT